MKSSLLTVATIIFCLTTVYSQTQLPQSAATATPAGSPEVKAADPGIATTPPGDAPPNVKPVGGKPALPPEKSNPVKLVHFAKPPVIDGKIDDEIWKSAVVLKDFYQIEPGDNIAPSKPTEVMLGYDERFLYVAFHCYDEPDKVRANIPKRDDIFNDDYVGILFDTFNDQRKAYEFDFNPLGIQADGTWNTGGNEDFSLDVVLQSKGMVTSDGYTIEVAIPFKSIRYNAGKDVLWGVHFWRRIKRFNNELDMWMPISRDISSWLAQAGHLTGFEGISTERTLELIPSLTISETGKRKAPVTLAQIAQGGRFVNEPIPFFLEGIEIFQTQIFAVHTRSIIDPDFAVKLTGKINRNTFGLLLASDNGPGNFSEEERPTADRRLLDKNASVGILRLKHDLGKSDSFIGFLGTYKRFVDSYNELGGFDGRFRIDKQTTFAWQMLGTHSRHQFFFPEEGQRLDRKENGFIYAVDYNKDGRHFGYDLSGVGRTRYYTSDLGFNRRPNSNVYNGFFRYNSEPKPKARLISWRVYDAINTAFDWQGRSQSDNNESQIQFNFPRQTTVGIGLDKGYERIFESEFGQKRQSGSNCVINNNCTFAGFDNERSTSNLGLYLFASSTINKKVNFNFFVNRRWGDLDFDFGAGPKFPRVSPSALNAANAASNGLCTGSNPPPVCHAPLDPGPGDFFHFDGGVTYQPTSALNATLSFTKERLKRYDTDRLAFDENIVSLRSTYQFSRFLFARGRIDYETLGSSVKGQFLLGYTPNPGTAFYVGYNDDLSRNGFNRFTGQLEPGFRRNGRVFFIKMSYLFRKSF